MDTYIALLRGINVGGNNKVEMKRLKELFESHGYINVTTYINSGNVLFDTTEIDPGVLATKIETVLQKNFGFHIPTIVRDKKRFKKLVESIPPEWDNGTEQKTDILFLWDSFDSKKSLQLLTLTDGVDTVLYHNGSIIWNIVRSGYSQSGVRKFIGSPLYKHMTARNVHTVRALNALLDTR